MFLCVYMQHNQSIGVILFDWGKEIGRFSRKTIDEIAKIFKERDIIYQSCMVTCIEFRSILKSKEMFPFHFFCVYTCLTTNMQMVANGSI